MADLVWPSIGGYVCDFIEAELRHGPGPVKGQHVELTLEEQRFIYSMYEVHPVADCGRPHCDCRRNVGKFRYEWAIYCRLKGARKSELAAWITHAELFGPCRFAGWDANGDPVASTLWELGSTADIPFAATAEDQVKDTAWASFYDIAQTATYADDLDIGLTKVTVKRNGAGNARVVTSSSISRDGGRPTFTVEEEPHLWMLPDLLELDRVLNYNLAKLGASDPHGLKVSTMYGVGEGSVLEQDHRAVQEDEDSGILFDLRSARDGLDPKNDDDIFTGIRDAIGDAVWLDDYRIYRKFKRSRDKAVRFWWNKRSSSDKRAIDPDEWKACAVDREPVPGELICIGFDGSLYNDSTALVVSCLADRYQWPALIYYPNGTEEDVFNLRAQVDLTLRELTDKFTLVRMYCDPPHWGEQIATWQGTYGDRVVLPWWTNRDLPMAWATHRWVEGIVEGTLTHHPDEEFAKQVANAHKRQTRIIVDTSTGDFGFVPTKDRPGSPHKIDAVISSILADEARLDAKRHGDDQPKKKRSGKVYAF